MKKSVSVFATTLLLNLCSCGNGQAGDAEENRRELKLFWCKAMIQREFATLSNHVVDKIKESPSQEKSMNWNTLRTRASRRLALLVVLAVAWQVRAQTLNAKTLYPSMAPLDQYLMDDRNSEIALARSAAPESISRDAEVMVLGRHGYETAIKGTNGFVCIVERSWTSPVDDAGFWNPKGRAPVCYNAAAARTYLPRTIKKTDLILAGRTKAQMIEAIAAAIDKKELPPMEVGAMCYMLSKQSYLSDREPHWHPHLMFFVSQTDPAAWGAGVQDSPISAFDDKWEHLTVFLVPVRQWSDGTLDR